MLEPQGPGGFFLRRFKWCGQGRAAPLLSSPGSLIFAALAGSSSGYCCWFYKKYVRVPYRYRYINKTNNQSWLAPVPASGSGSGSGSRLRLPALTNKKIGSGFGAALKVSGSGSVTLLYSICMADWRNLNPARCVCSSTCHLLSFALASIDLTLAIRQTLANVSF